MGKKQNKIMGIIGWLLLAILVFPYFVQAFHSHENEGCCHENEEAASEHTSHDCATCLVCQFTLSAFTEPDKISFSVFRTVRSFSLCMRLPEMQPVSLFSFFLRAPPL